MRIVAERASRLSRIAAPAPDVPMRQEPVSTHLVDHVADLPFDDLINYPISRSIAMNSN